MPVDYKRYPKNWKRISERIRYERAENKCEWCGVSNGALILRSVEDGSRYIISDDEGVWHYPDGEAIRLSEIPDEYNMREKETRVILTVAHRATNTIKWTFGMRTLPRSASAATFSTTWMSMSRIAAARDWRSSARKSGSRGRWSYLTMKASEGDGMKTGDIDYLVNIRCKSGNEYRTRMASETYAEFMRVLMDRERHHDIIIHAPQNVVDRDTVNYIFLDQIEGFSVKEVHPNMIVPNHPAEW